MCGKDENPSWQLSMEGGSPLHVRERQNQGIPASCCPGITPACAGKTGRQRSGRLPGRDHPRMCGKDRKVFIYSLNFGGSPPHVRERHRVTEYYLLFRGITPACAGKTKRWSNTTRWARDHPRMCGKDHGMSSLCNHGLGSPPHVRERHRRRPYAVRRTRITPACAGKTVPHC